MKSPHHVGRDRRHRGPDGDDPPVRAFSVARPGRPRRKAARLQVLDSGAADDKDAWPRRPWSSSPPDQPASVRFWSEFNNGAWARGNRGLVQIVNISKHDNADLVALMEITRFPTVVIYTRGSKGVTKLGTITDCATAEGLAAWLQVLDTGVGRAGQTDASVTPTLFQRGRLPIAAIPAVSPDAAAAAAPGATSAPAAPDDDDGPADGLDDGRRDPGAEPESDDPAGRLRETSSSRRSRRRWSMCLRWRPPLQRPRRTTCSWRLHPSPRPPPPSPSQPWPRLRHRRPWRLRRARPQRPRAFLAASPAPATPRARGGPPNSRRQQPDAFAAEHRDPIERARPRPRHAPIGTLPRR